MKKNKLIKELKYFVEPHPVFKDSEEEIYSVKEGLKIKLWLDGGFTVELEPKIFEINYNAISIGILVIADREKGNILRILSKKIIGIELVRNNNSNEDLAKLFELRESQKN
jgi:hypothetical protein